MEMEINEQELTKKRKQINKVDFYFIKIIHILAFITLISSDM